MANKITISVPDDLLKKFKEYFPETNVAELARRVIAEKIADLKKMEELKAKGKL